MAYVYKNNITALTFEFDQRKKSRIRAITEGYGHTTKISYTPLINNPHHPMYTCSTKALYPYVNIANSNMIQVVEQIRDENKSTVKLYRYHGATSHNEGLGFLGFKGVSESEWYPYQMMESP